LGQKRTGNQRYERVSESVVQALLGANALLGNTVDVAVGAVGSDTFEVFELVGRVGLDGLGAFGPVSRADFTVEVL